MSNLPALSLSLATAVLSAVMAASSAAAGDWAFVDRTLAVTFPSGDSAEYVYASDGTYTASSGEAGAWSFDGETFCFMPDGGEELCGPFDGSHGPGDSWTAPAWDGSGDVTFAIQ